MNERDFLDRSFDDDPERAESASPGSIRWDWFIALTAAWIVFECFAQPALSVVVASIRFGWADFRNAVWLWRRDPDSRRGRACAVLYLACGFWRITVTTFLIMLAVAVVTVFAELEALGRNAPQRPPVELAQIISLLIVSAAFVISSVMTWLGMFLSWRSGLKVWLDRSISISRRINEWPPHSTGRNNLSGVVTGSLLFATLAVVVVSIVMAVSAFAPGRGGPGWVVLASLTGMIFAALLILSVRDQILGSHLAGSPAECWDGDKVCR